MSSCNYVLTCPSQKAWMITTPPWVPTMKIWSLIKRPLSAWIRPTTSFTARFASIALPGFMTSSSRILPRPNATTGATSCWRGAKKKILQFPNMCRDGWEKWRKENKFTLRCNQKQKAAMAYPYQIKNFDDYQQAYHQSVVDPEGFWANVAETFMWRRKWDKVLEWNFKDPNIKWFQGGKLNITENCLDRHLGSLGNTPAIIWEPNDPEERHQQPRTPPRRPQRPRRPPPRPRRPHP